MLEHQTYNMLFAVAAFQEGLEVWVTSTHPDIDLIKLHDLAEIVDCNGRLIVIKKGEKNEGETFRLNRRRY